MEGPVVHSIVSEDGRRRVDIFRRAGGTYGFEEWRWDPEYDCWAPVGRYSQSFCDTPERAEAEARGRVSWLAEPDAGRDLAGDV